MGSNGVENVADTFAAQGARWRFIAGAAHGGLAGWGGINGLTMLAESAMTPSCSREAL
jgi:hypothetical protein